jgi:hypothetical protein
MRELIKAGICVAYDWHLLKNSLPLIYQYADRICLSIDKNKRSWSGIPYAFDNVDFRKFVDQIDSDKKIDIYEDDFSVPDLSAIENDNRQRNLMAKRLGKGGWHIQIDSDEYFTDFDGFCKYLDKQDIHQKEINICCPFISLYKKTDNGFLYIPFGKNTELVPIATNKPSYENARRNGYFNHISPFFIVHDSWARDDLSLMNKLNSWGHVNDFNKGSYFKLWQSLDDYNYKYLANFHPLNQITWPKLNFIEARSIADLIEQFKKFPPSIDRYWLIMRNSRFISKLKSLLLGKH